MLLKSDCQVLVDGKEQLERMRVKFARTLLKRRHGTNVINRLYRQFGIKLKGGELAALIHRRRFKTRRPALGQFPIGGVGQFSVGANTQVDSLLPFSNPT